MFTKDQSNTGGYEGSLSTLVLQRPINRQDTIKEKITGKRKDGKAIIVPYKKEWAEMDTGWAAQHRNCCYVICGACTVLQSY